MPESLQNGSVSVLEEHHWYEEFAHSTAPFPFGARPWIRWGLAQHSNARFLPVRIRGQIDGELLVPLLVRGTTAQIGCFGYSMVCPSPTSLNTPEPELNEIAPLLVDGLGFSALHSLLPPPALLNSCDSHIPTGSPTRPGPTTYLLPLFGDQEQVWARARGSARTAVRRAHTLGLTVSDAENGDSAALRALYDDTMRRLGVDPPLGLDLDFLTTPADKDFVTHVATSSTAAQAICSFAISGQRAFHIVQATSDDGLRTNAGSIAFWSAVTDLASQGVIIADLGSANSPGQERFKKSWGAQRHDTQFFSWERGDR